MVGDCRSDGGPHQSIAIDQPIFNHDGEDLIGLQFPTCDFIMGLDLVAHQHLLCCLLGVL